MICLKNKELYSHVYININIYQQRYYETVFNIMVNHLQCKTIILGIKEYYVQIIFINFYHTQDEHVI